MPVTEGPRAWVRPTAEGHLGIPSELLHGSTAVDILDPGAQGAIRLGVPRGERPGCTPPALVNTASLQSGCTNLHPHQQQRGVRGLFCRCLSLESWLLAPLTQGLSRARTCARALMCVCTHGAQDSVSEPWGTRGGQAAPGLVQFKLGNLPLEGLEQLLYWGRALELGPGKDPSGEPPGAGFSGAEPRTSCEGLPLRRRVRHLLIRRVCPPVTEVVPAEILIPSGSPFLPG